MNKYFLTFLLITCSVITSLAQNFTSRYGTSFSEDGSLIAIAAKKIDSTGTEKGIVLHVWETATGKEKAVFHFKYNLFNTDMDPFITQDNKYVYYSYDEKNKRGEKGSEKGFLCNLETGKIEREDDNLLIFPAGRFGDNILSGVGSVPYLEETYFYAFDPITKTKERTGYSYFKTPVAKNSSKPWQLHILKDGTAIYLSSIDDDYYITFWKPGDTKPLSKINVGSLSESKIKVSSDEKWLAVPGSDVLISIEKMKKAKKLSLEEYNIHRFAFDNQNRLVMMSGNLSKLTRIRKYNPLTEKYEYEGISRSRTKGQLLSPMGNYMLSVTDTLLTVYDIESDSEGVPLKNSKSLPYVAKGNISYEKLFKTSGTETGFCKSCNGSGKGYSEQNCSTCMGKGGKNCNMCGGKRYVYNAKGQSSHCTFCSGQGKQTCYTCYGSGKKKASTGCSQCGGTGTVTAK